MNTGPLPNVSMKYTRFLSLSLTYIQANFETKRFAQFHRRLQTFLLWFIEGATYLEDDDARWQFALLWKKNLGENGSG
jgi:hypothetical protein